MKMIELTRGFSAIVDDEDYERLSAFEWYAAKSRSKFYASRSVGRTMQRMHNLILPPSEGMLIDHLNGNSLDNRRANLRICTRSENVINSTAKKTSKHLGVSFHQREKKWVASIIIGRYATEAEAALAFQVAQQKIRT